MTALIANVASASTSNISLSLNRQALIEGDILLQTRNHSAWGGAVTAQMFLPRHRSAVWSQITNYSRWVEFFPDVVRSEIIGASQGKKRLYQLARKAFLFFTAEAEIQLSVSELIDKTSQKLQFVMEQGTFKDFSATLELQDYDQGTLLTYSVQATPSFPVPSTIIQQAMRLDLPANMKQMRRVICGR
ncbi:MAG: SRPBCC family protein [Cyanobacteria bacterium P01_A01_bin.135]